MDEITGAESPDDALRRYLKADEMRLQDCDRCGRQVFPPRVLCPGCGDTSLTWNEIDPSAHVYATTTVRRRPDRGGDYNIAIIELAGGARLLSRVAQAAPDEVAIGDRVTATIDTLGNTRVIGFRPSQEVTR